MKKHRKNLGFKARRRRASGRPATTDERLAKADARRQRTQPSSIAKVEPSQADDSVAVVETQPKPYRVSGNWAGAPPPALDQMVG